jgi:uncharacterized protein with GYD domain
MKYVLLGELGPEWAGRHAERIDQAKAKLKELNIKLEAVYYTQGQFDFVDIVDAPSPEAMLTFSVWYVKQGFGRFHSLPAFDDAAMRAALKKT